MNQGSRLGGVRVARGTVLAALVTAVIWEGLGQLAHYRFLPPLSQVVERVGILATRGDLLPSLATSLGNLALGLTLAIGFGVAIGLLMGSSRRLYVALELYVHAFLIVPSIVFAPVFFSMFGLGREPVIAVIVMFAIFKIIINTAEGVRSTRLELREMALSFGAGRLGMFRLVTLPSALPLTLAAIRVGTGSAVQGMVVAEMFIAVVGLGAIVMRAGRRFDAETVLATVVVLILIALVLTAVVRLVDGRLTSWLPSTFRAAGTR